MNDEYPSPAPRIKNLLIAILFGAFITLFLLFFEPFGIDVASGKNSLASLFFFGLITTYVLFIYLFIGPVLFPSVFSDKRWRVKHQITFSVIILFSIATCNGVYTNYINSLDFSWENYWWIINRTFVLGVIPFSFLIILDYFKKKQSHLQEAKDILYASKKIDSFPKGSVWTIRTDLKDEVFSFDDENFSHAMADGNYTDIYLYRDGQNLKSHTYRITLASFEEQLEASYLKRCHRSYLVNLNKVVNVSGNAQGLKLVLDGHNNPIPVSRKFIAKIKDFFNNGTCVD